MKDEQLKAHIQAFVQRPRQPVEALKAEWWASHADADSEGSALEVAHALLEHARQVDPSFPSAEYLAADLEHHILLKQRLDRASKALASRADLKARFNELFLAQATPRRR